MGLAMGVARGCGNAPANPAVSASPAVGTSKSVQLAATGSFQVYGICRETLLSPC